MATRMWRWPIIGVVLLSAGGVAVVASGVLPHPTVRWAEPAANAATTAPAVVPAVAATVADAATAPAQPPPPAATAPASTNGGQITATPVPEPRTTVAQAGGPAVQWVSPPGAGGPPAPSTVAPAQPAVTPVVPHPTAPARQTGATSPHPAPPATGATAVAPRTSYEPPPAAAVPAAPHALSPFQACAGDFRAFCSGVEPGQGRGLRCLLQHGPRLSPGCSGALASARAAAPMAPPPLTGAAMRAAIEACWQDFSVLCAGVQPGEGRGAMCLHEHAAQLSPGCRDALLAARAAR